MKPPRLTHLVIKPTLRCTASCPTCASRRELHRRKRREPEIEIGGWLALFPEFEQLGLQTLTLSGGEPLLYPELGRLITEGKRRGWTVTLNTNGSLADATAVDQLLDAGLDRVMISLYAGSAEVHDGLRRRRGLWQAAVDGARRFKARAATERSRLQLNLQTILCRENLRTLPQLIELGAELGVAGILFSYLEGDHEQRRHLLDEDEITVFRQEVIPRAAAVISDVIADPWTRQVATAAVQSLCSPRIGSPRQLARGIYRAARPCPIPSHFSILLANGDVHPCNMVEYSHHPVMGNLRQRGFSEMWRGETWSAFRRDGFDLCRYCPVPSQVYIPIGSRPRFPRAEIASLSPPLKNLRARLDHELGQQRARLRASPLGAVLRRTHRGEGR